jgi:hypothetical protein
MSYVYHLDLKTPNIYSTNDPNDVNINNKACTPTLPDHVRSSSGVYKIRLVQSLVSYVVFCRSLLVLLTIVLSILPQVTAFDCLIGIFGFSWY